MQVKFECHRLGLGWNHMSNILCPHFWVNYPFKPKKENVWIFLWIVFSQGEIGYPGIPGPQGEKGAAVQSLFLRSEFVFTYTIINKYYSDVFVILLTGASWITWTERGEGISDNFMHLKGNYDFRTFHGLYISLTSNREGEETLEKRENQVLMGQKERRWV